MHKLGYLHRDIKPANIMVGRAKNAHLIYLIDFGLSKKLEECSGGYSYSRAKPKKMAGTPIYASINAHMATGGNLFQNILNYNRLFQEG
jgi:serine/threonine protein kinase